MCIIHGLNSANEINPELKPHITNFFQFIMITLDKKRRPTVNYLKRCILLMADLAKFYPVEVSPLKK
jgi:hypothetical protein